MQGRLIVIGTGNGLTAPPNELSHFENGRRVSFPKPGQHFHYASRATSPEVSAGGGKDYGLLTFDDWHYTVQAKADDFGPIPDELKVVDGTEFARGIARQFARYGVLMIEGEEPTSDELARAKAARRRDQLEKIERDRVSVEMGRAGHQGYSPIPGRVAEAMRAEQGIPSLQLTAAPTLPAVAPPAPAGPSVAEDTQCPECRMYIASDARKCRYCQAQFGMPLLEKLTKPVAAAVTTVVLLFSLLFSAPVAKAQSNSCLNTILSATGTTQLKIDGERFNTVGASYYTTGTPASVSVTLKAGNVGNTSTQAPFSKIGPITNTSGADMGTAVGVYRYWFITVTTLSGGSSPTIVLTTCFSNQSWSRFTGSGAGNLSGTLTATYLPVATAGTTLANSNLTDASNILTYTNSGGNAFIRIQSDGASVPGLLFRGPTKDWNVFTNTDSTFNFFQATDALVAMKFNTDGSVTVPVKLSVTGRTALGTVHFASLGAVVPGQTFYCDDCDPSVSSGVAKECTSAGTKTGAIVFGTNAKWACMSVN